MTEETMLKYQIAYTSFFIAGYTFTSGLDLLVLFGYYRLGKRLSARAALLVANSLR